MPPEHREHGQHHVDMNSRFTHRISIGFWILDAASTADSGSGRRDLSIAFMPPTRESSGSPDPIRAPVNHDSSGYRPSRFSRSRNCLRPFAFLGSFPSQDQDLLLEQLLHAVLGHVKLGDGHLEPVRGIGPREALDGREPERLPVPRLDPLLDPVHGQLDQLAVERTLEAALQVGQGILPLGEQVHLPLHAALEPPPGAGEIGQGMLGHGLSQDRSCGTVVLELADRGQELDQHLLGDIIAVGSLKPHFLHQSSIIGR